MTTGKFARAAKTFNDSNAKDANLVGCAARTVRAPDAAQRNPGLFWRDMIALRKPVWLLQGKN